MGYGFPLPGRPLPGELPCARARSFLVTLRSAVALATLATAAHAQSRTTTLPSGKVFDFTPYVGYMVFDSYMDGPFGTSLGNAPAPVYGVQLGMHVAPNISIVGNVAASSSDIKAGIPILRRAHRRPEQHADVRRRTCSSTSP